MQRLGRPQRLLCTRVCLLCMLTHACRNPSLRLGETGRWVCNLPQAMYTPSSGTSCLFRLHMSFEGGLLAVASGAGSHMLT